VETIGLTDLLNGDQTVVIKLRVIKRDGQTFEIPTKHTMSTDQLNWFKAGSALNFIRSQMA
jgi:homoaconitase